MNILLGMALFFSVIMVGFAVVRFANVILSSQEKILTEFHDVRNALLNASTPEEYNDALKLVDKWKVTLWHRSHDALAYEIKGIIDSKYIELTTKYKE